MRIIWFELLYKIVKNILFIYICYLIWESYDPDYYIWLLKRNYKYVLKIVSKILKIDFKLF